MFSGEFREDVIGAKQTVRSQVIDCFFTKFAKDVLKKEQRTVSWRRRLGAREERRHWRSDARSQPREIRCRSLATSTSPKGKRDDYTRFSTKRSRARMGKDESAKTSAHCLDDRGVQA